MADRKSFVVRLESIEQLEMLDDAQRGALFMAMCYYVRDGVVPSFEDPMLKMMFSVIKQQLDRDAEKYEETCKKNAENGKKGGRPKKTERFSEKPRKSERFFEKPKKADSDSDSDSECECDPEPECDPDCDLVCDCDSERVRADSTTHTPQQPISLQEVLALAERFGYHWDEAEAREFLAYNIDNKQRTAGWSFAVQKWEEHREERRRWKRRKTRAPKTMTQQEIDEMNDYLSVSNRFKEDEEHG